MFTIDFNPFLNAVVWPTLGVVGSALAAVIAAWLAKKFSDKLGLQAIAHLQTTLESGIKNGLQIAQAKVASSNIASVTVQSKIIADAATYVIANVPDTAKSLGIDLETEEGRGQLKEKLMARLAPAILAGAAVSSEVTVGAAATQVNPEIVTTPLPVIATDQPVIVVPPALPPKPSTLT